MPRIAVCLNIADIDKPHFSGENDYLDFCDICYRRTSVDEIAAAYGLPVDAVDKIDDEHPQYQGEDYQCEKCRCLLRERDN